MRFSLFLFLQQISQVSLITGGCHCSVPTRCFLISLNFPFNSTCAAVPLNFEWPYLTDARLEIQRDECGFRVMKGTFMFDQANDPNFTPICFI